MKKLQTFDSSLFNNDGAQLYLIFQLIYKTVTTFSGFPRTILEWESKGLSKKKLKPPYKSLSPKLISYNSRIKLKIKGSGLKKNVVNLFIVYNLDTWSQDINTEFTLKNCLFGSVKLTRNADLDKYKYSS